MEDTKQTLEQFRESLAAGKHELVLAANKEYGAWVELVITMSIEYGGYHVDLWVRVRDDESSPSLPMIGPLNFAEATRAYFVIVSSMKEMHTICGQIIAETGGNKQDRV